MTPCRANIQFMFPRRVLISPLWHINRLGWARSQLGNVFVEKAGVHHGEVALIIAVLEVRKIGE